MNLKKIRVFFLNKQLKKTILSNCCRAEFLDKRLFCTPKKCLAVFGDVFGLQQLVGGNHATDIRDASKHTVIHRTASTTKNYSAQSASSAHEETLL